MPLVETATPTVEGLTSEVKAVKAALATEQKQHARVKAYKIDMEAALVRAAEAWFADQPLPRMSKPHRDGRKKGEEVAVMLYCDPHLGAKGIDFNSTIARDRTMRYAEKVCELASIQRADHPVSDMRLWMLGDIVQGELIYPTAPYEMDMTLIDQLTGGGFTTVRDMILRLLVDFRNIHIVVIPGNHGRIGARKGQVFHPDTNSDRILGEILRIAFNAEPRVTWTIPHEEADQIGWCVVDQIGNYSALLLHGHQFRGGSSGGVPWYGVDKKALRFHHLGGRTAGLPAFQDIYCGHYHRVVKIPSGAVRVRIGGSLQSTSPFELQDLAAFTPPAQLLVFVHPEKGIVTSEHEVYLG